MSDKVVFDKQGPIAVLTLNQPDTRNALTDSDLVDAIVAACESVAADPDISALIVTGAGSAFSSGGNIKHMRDKTGTFAGDAATVRENYRKGIQRIPRALYELEVPTIAAVNGPAHGAGCDLAVMCDMRIAATTALFAESFLRVGIIPGDGGAWLLPRAIGTSRAMQMAFTADEIDAETALAWGLVNEVVEPERLMERALELAGRIVRHPPVALRMTKRLIREGERMSLDSLLQLSAAYQGAIHQTEDHVEAVTALLEKRRPSFTGR